VFSVTCFLSLTMFAVRNAWIVQDSCNLLTSPSACLLRFLKLPEDEHKLVSLKDVAVIIMAYLEQMADNYVSSHGLYKVQTLLITGRVTKSPSVRIQDNWKSYRRVLMTFCAEVRHGPRRNCSDFEIWIFWGEFWIIQGLDSWNILG